MIKNFGYTLIEILVVISVSAILMGVGLFSLNTLNKRQVLVQNAKMVVSDLRLTKNLADAQQKPDVCGISDALNGYSLTITGGKIITINAVCNDSGSHLYQSRTTTAVLSNVTLVFFPVLQQPAEITSGNGTNQLIVTQNSQHITISIGISGVINYEYE